MNLRRVPDNAPHFRRKKKLPSPGGEGGTAKAVTDEVEKKMDTSSVAFGDSFPSRGSLIQSHAATASPQGEASGCRKTPGMHRRARRPFDFYPQATTCASPRSGCKPLPQSICDRKMSVFGL